MAAALASAARAKLGTLKRVAATHGTGGLVRYLAQRYVRRPYWHRRHAPIAGFASLAKLFRERRGLEIGGPSPAFRRSGPLPIYVLARSMDNCDYAAKNLWHSHGEAAGFAADGRVLGRQLIADGRSLDRVAAPASYDFLVSSNFLEHVADPIGMLEVMGRALTTAGTLVVVVPSRRANFEWRRPVTPLAHLIEDWKARTPETDRTHFAEVLSTFDFALGGPVQSIETLRDMVERNNELRCVHHHVFDAVTLREILTLAGFTVLTVRDVGTDFLAIARK